ncbi:MAG TPA: methyltransferase domain-containing protein [Acidimicrobiales bacterium]|nr:methyltransferase domain-containing protein [Acidimicrobiales bacterium]
MSKAPHRLFFDAWSRVYDLAPVQLAVYRPVHARVLRELASGDLKRLLDIGCGTGNLTSRLAQSARAELVAGCDFSFGMLEQAAAKRVPAAWLQGDAARLPIRDGSVDAVTSTDSFHWFPDPDGALAELRRVLRPGGRLIIAVVNPRLGATASLFRAGSTLLGEPARWPTRAELAQRMERAGFVVRSQQRVVRAAGIAFPTYVTVGVAPPSGAG